MTLMRYHPTTPPVPAADLLREFFDLQMPSIARARAGMNTWSPALDVHDGADAFTVRLEAAGLNKDDFTLTFQDGVLSIAGERKADEGSAGRNYFRRERFVGRFSRSVSLPAAVNASAISATYKDGVLEVTLPKAEEAKPKQIEVQMS